jgi:hypothetical protein
VIGKAVIGLCPSDISGLPLKGERCGIRHLSHAPHGVTSAVPNSAARIEARGKKFCGEEPIFLEMKQLYDYVRLAQIRTCLWPRVDR